jgi:hypothetical protein
MRLIKVEHGDKIVTIELDKLDLDIINTITHHPVFGVDLRGTAKCTDGNVCELINELVRTLGG